jgi:hypothetical protein
MKLRHYIASLLFALFIVYPLSIGPAEWWARRHYPGPIVPKWAVIYDPLLWAGNELPFLRTLMIRYEAWWWDIR